VTSRSIFGGLYLGLYLAFHIFDVHMAGHVAYLLKSVVLLHGYRGILVD
jgi:hypothetical protein